MKQLIKLNNKHFQNKLEDSQLLLISNKKNMKMMKIRKWLIKVKLKNEKFIELK